MREDRTCFLSKDDTERLHKAIDHLGLNNRTIAALLGVSRQYIGYIFAKQTLSERMCSLLSALAQFLTKLIERNPNISLRHLACESIEEHRKRKREHLVAIKKAFSSYVKNNE